MELHQANQLSDQTPKKKSWLCEELDIRNKAFQEDRARDCREIDESRSICCAEADRARQSYDELSTQQEENPFTANQLMVHIQELQDTVNSWNDSQDFYDPETASSSGLSHVPSQPVSVPSPRGMVSRDSCLQPETRNSIGTSGNVF